NKHFDDAHAIDVDVEGVGMTITQFIKENLDPTTEHKDKSTPDPELEHRVEKEVVGIIENVVEHEETHNTGEEKSGEEEGIM
ncbi:hypothetical protein KI387_022236, partial [Taxus chinensis]